MLVHELIVFTVSDAFEAHPAATLKTAAEFFARTNGCLSVYGGKAEEEKIGYILIAWESMAHQVLKDSNGYPKNIGLGPVFEEGSKRQGFHLDLTGSADESLAMPTTETLLMTLKKNKTKEDPAAALDTLIPRLHAEAGCSRSIAWGQTQEDLRTVHLFLGWTSRERHLAVVGQDSYAEAIINLFSQVDIPMHHVSFKKVL